MSGKLLYHTVKILEVIRHVHIRLRNEDRHLPILHLKDTVQIGHIMVPEYCQYDIDRDQSQDHRRDRP